jgi:hypothetical protein
MLLIDKFLNFWIKYFTYKWKTELFNFQQYFSCVLYVCVYIIYIVAIEWIMVENLLI